MLEQIFASPGIANRLRCGVLGGFLDDFATVLDARRYCLRTIRQYVRGAGHFSFWLGVARISLSEINEDTAREFLVQHVPQCRCPVPRGGPIPCLRASVRHALTILRDQGLIGPRPVPEPRAWAGLLDTYAGHLRRVKGASPATIKNYSHAAEHLLEARFAAGPFGIESLSRDDVLQFVLSRADRCAPGSLQRLTSALRSFLRFLHLEAHCDVELVESVPTVSARMVVRPPTALDEDQLSAFLGAFDQATSIGLRDYGMALCMTDLGMRCGEVAALTLDDLNWRAATLEIPHGKSRRVSRLPLPERVGSALSAYLRDGRPTTECRCVFVHHGRPRGTPITTSAVRAAIRRAFIRAGIDTPSKGTHILRRTAATRMVEVGATLKEVADVLRHRSIDTTVLYARSSLRTLSAVAMAWPEVRR